MSAHYRRFLVIASTALLVACGGQAPEEPTVVTMTTVVAESTPEPTTPVAHTPTSSPEPASPAVDMCAPGMFADDIPITVMYCDEEWAYVGRSQSGNVWVTRNIGGEWVEYVGDGTTSSGMTRSCFLQDRVAKDGVPREIVDKLAICQPGDSVG
ncbi:hypothetical protein [Corynebacterium nasicanis]|uniref:Secreted protein n=1 Tax=Corynebacterium nasicanis TaxID=1448267 RepID=A0ABW1Q9Y5_9CORY